MLDQDVNNNKTDFLHLYKYPCCTLSLNQRQGRLGWRHKTVTQVTSIGQKSPMFSEYEGEGNTRS